MIFIYIMILVCSISFVISIIYLIKYWFGYKVKARVVGKSTKKFDNSGYSSYQRQIPVITFSYTHKGKEKELSKLYFFSKGFFKARELNLEVGEEVLFTVSSGFPSVEMPWKPYLHTFSLIIINSFMLLGLGFMYFVILYS